MKMQHQLSYLIRSGLLVTAALILNAGAADQQAVTEPIHIKSSQQFTRQVLKADGPVLVDFYADWCGPCKLLAPALVELAREQAGKVKVAKVNVDDNQKLAKTYGVKGIPHVALFRDGKVVDTQIGIRSSDTASIKADLLRWLKAQNALGDPPGK